MSDLSAHGFDPKRQADLRGRATSRLNGAAHTPGHATNAVDALAVLHALASSPQTATDALTLLHELQVHQVEIDLQAQELQDARADLESALRRQTELYDFQPVGCCTVDARLALHELNQSGADMLGIARDEAYGQGLDTWVRTEDLGPFKAAISSVDAGQRRATCRIRLCPSDGPERVVLASIAKDPAADRYLVNLADTEAAQASEPRAN